MDKDFWDSIAKDDYRVPNGRTLEELTGILFEYISSTDPELRDEIAYVVYANWLKRQVYSRDEIRAHVDQLLANLNTGLGAVDSDSVFLRTFSILFLAEIVHNDNKAPLLSADQVQAILADALRYLETEKDPRGHIPIKGWAHALAHTADLLLTLGENRHIGPADLKHMLTGIAEKLIRSSDWIYIHGEDDRLANAVIAMLRRDLIPPEDWENWLQSLNPSREYWKGSYMDEDRARAFHNVRNFLRSLSEAIRSNETLPQKRWIQSKVFQALDLLKPY